MLGVHRIFRQAESLLHRVRGAPCHNFSCPKSPLSGALASGLVVCVQIRDMQEDLQQALGIRFERMFARRTRHQTN
jgi:hypothetical protein